jgi:hypothetical protein
MGFGRLRFSGFSSPAQPSRFPVMSVTTTHDEISNAKDSYFYLVVLSSLLEVPPAGVL